MSRHKRKDNLPAYRRGTCCHICGLEIPLDIVAPSHDLIGTIDHVIPLGAGGTDAAANRQPAHRLCNITKGHRMMSAELADECRASILSSDAARRIIVKQHLKQKAIREFAAKSKPSDPESHMTQQQPANPKKQRKRNREIYRAALTRWFCDRFNISYHIQASENKRLYIGDWIQGSEGWDTFYRRHHDLIWMEVDRFLEREEASPTYSTTNPSNPRLTTISRTTRCESSTESPNRC